MRVTEEDRRASHRLDGSEVPYSIRPERPIVVIDSVVPVEEVKLTHQAKEPAPSKSDFEVAVVDVLRERMASKVSDELSQLPRVLHDSVGVRERSGAAIFPVFAA